MGFASGYEAMKNCDRLLMLGTDFPYRQFFPEQASIAQVDIRPEALGNRCPLNLGLIGERQGDPGLAAPKVENKSDRSHLDDALADYRRARKALDALAESGPHTQHYPPAVRDPGGQRAGRR